MMQLEKARVLRSWLSRRETFILPEVWDVASARILVDAGFRAVGTSATAIAWASGHRPHERVKLEELLVVAARIARGCRVPVNADLDGGVGRSVTDVERAARAALAAGCAGITIGDGNRNGSHGMVPVGEMADRVAAAREASDDPESRLVITARTEAFLLGPLGRSPFETAIERAEAYFEAGADCLLVPGVQHLQVVERLTGIVKGAMAISVSLSSAPKLDDYSHAGVACVTLGSSLMRAVLTSLRQKTEQLVAFGEFSHLQGAITVEELEALLR